MNGLNNEQEKTSHTLEICCPFCGEDGFDLIGLKYHLLNYCEQFENTERIKRMTPFKQIVITFSDHLFNDLRIISEKSGLTIEQVVLAAAQKYVEEDQSH